jgi:hypothetical protein
MILGLKNYELNVYFPPMKQLSFPGQGCNHYLAKVFSYQVRLIRDNLSIEKSRDLCPAESALRPT